MGELIVILIRLAVPFAIFRWPLAGALACMLVDALDVVLIELIDLGGFSNYAALDKALDTYYLSFEAIVSLRWQPLPKWTSLGLFAYRLVGVVIFEVTQVRFFLLLFPNLFENFFVVYLVLQRVSPRFVLTPSSAAALLALLLVPKLGQEYLLHHAEAQPWHWTKTHVLGAAWPF